METKVLAVLFSALALTSGANVFEMYQSRGVPNAPDGLVHVTSYQDVQVNANLCPLCVSFTGQAIDQLLNIILNAGVVTGCSDICGLLANKTGSQIIGAACNILCDIEGVQEFIKLVEKADLDPIYLCELLKVCPIMDNGDAKITQLTVSPASGPQGPRDITIGYISKNGTGTGELAVEIMTVDGVPVGDSFLQAPQPAGSYNQTIKLKATEDPNCDPSQGPCEAWLPGNYTVKVEICNGECGSKHPHSAVYDLKQAVFAITGN